jgi:hypothetical protein
MHGALRGTGGGSGSAGCKRDGAGGITTWPSDYAERMWYAALTSDPISGNSARLPRSLRRYRCTYEIVATCGNVVAFVSTFAIWGPTR